MFMHRHIAVFSSISLEKIKRKMPTDFGITACMGHLKAEFVLVSTCLIISVAHGGWVKGAILRMIVHLVQTTL